MEGMRPVDPGAGPESTAPRAPMARPTRSAASPASESRYSTDPGWPDSDGSTARPRALCDRARARVPVGGQTYRFRALTRSGPVLSESELSDFAGELGRLGCIGAFKTRLEYVTMISARPRKATLEIFEYISICSPKPTNSCLHVLFVQPTKLIKA